jgi:hypothetical protein
MAMFFADISRTAYPPESGMYPNEGAEAVVTLPESPSVPIDRILLLKYE